MSRRPRAESGFTLIETVIAMLIMSIAVVTIVGALAAMIGFTSQHRGNAVVEVGARSFAQAVEAQGQFQTTLAAAVPSASTTSLSVANASLIPKGSQSYIKVNREVMQVSAVSGNTLTVVRAKGGVTPTGGHLAGDAVSPFTVCPNAATVTPAAGTYQATKGLTFTVTTVEYWRPSLGVGGGGAFALTSAASCSTDFTAKCPAPEIAPECLTGLLRVTVTIKSSDSTNANYDPRFKDVDGTTVVLVRRGGS